MSIVECIICDKKDPSITRQLVMSFITSTYSNYSLIDGNVFPILISISVRKIFVRLSGR